MIETIEIKSNEKLRNRTIENAIIKVSGHNANLGVLRLINCKIEFYQVESPRVENIVFEKGLDGHDEAILVSGCIGARFTDVSGDNVQRLYNFDMRGIHDYCQAVVDGGRVGKFLNTMNVGNREESIIIHGYPNAKNPTADIQIRNIDFSQREVSTPITIWNANVERFLMHECVGMRGPIQIGFPRVRATIERLEIRDCNTETPQILWRHYDDGPLTADMIQEIKVPSNWTHRLLRNGGRNPISLGEWATVEELKEFVRNNDGTDS